MENLFKLTREASSLSIAQLAEKSSLSKTTIIRTEQGLYPTPSPQLVEALNLDWNLALVAYQAFQFHIRTSKGRLFFASSDLFSLPSRSKEVHPFVWLLNGRSNLEFCKAFCVRPDVVQKFVTSYRRYSSVPQPIINALVASGVSNRAIHTLRREYERFRNFSLDLDRRSNGLVEGKDRKSDLNLKGKNRGVAS